MQVRSAARLIRLCGCVALLVACGGRLAGNGGDDVAVDPGADPSVDAATPHPRDAGTDVGVTRITPDATPTPGPKATPDAQAVRDAQGGPPADAGADDAAPDVAPFLCSPDAAIPDADVPAYVAVAQRLGACSPAVLAAYIAACYTNDSTETECDDWYADAGNASCIECLIPTDSAGQTTNNGGLLLDPAGYAVSANLPGCIALVDPKNGPACAEVLELQEQCQFQACGGCEIASTSDACFADVGASGGACSGYDVTACNAYVSDAGVPLAACATPTAVIDVICGAGP